MNPIIEETIRLANETTLTVAEICKLAGIKPRWYHRFIAGDFSDPGVNKVLRLHEVLSNNKGKAA